VSRSLAHEIHRTPHAFYTDSIQPVQRREDRTRVLDASPCIIVASSGMLSGGPSAGDCQELAKNANDAILLTGYQDEESPGRALLDLARSEGPKQLRLGQATVPVACLFGTYGLSAHADRLQMVSLIEAASPRTVALVHGDEGAKQSLARSLRCSDVQLKQANPKGNLLEWCAKYKTAPPRFERDASPEGYRIRAVVSVNDQEEIATAWYEAAKLKTAEQAAAEAILPRLPAEPTSETGPSAVAIPEPVDFTPEPASGRNPVAALNELTQAGLLQANGYELLDPSGPSHQPTFTAVAWATIPDGRTIRSEPISGSSKKAGQRAAAGRLLDLLVQEGITGR
jgi:dsRNA-specific ribonuclease